MKGHIYFLRHGEFVKIGFSTNYLERCAAISACTPEETKVVAVHIGHQSDETLFHRLLSAHRHRLEWFRWNSEVEAVALSGLPKRQEPLLPGASALEALRQTISGVDLARAVKTTPQAVSQWKRVPLNRVFDVERVTGVSRHDLRPDFFDKSESAA